MQRLVRHMEDIRPLVSGILVLGDAGQIDILYDGEKCDRAKAAEHDKAALLEAGYHARIVGHHRMVSVSFTNVGDHINARYVK